VEVGFSRCVPRLTDVSHAATQGLSIYRDRTLLETEIPGYEEMYGPVTAIMWSAAAFGDVVVFGTESSWIFILSNALKPEVSMNMYLILL
jgi:hypothetical protein